MGLDIFKEDERKIIYNTFILSNFNYCPIVWHFCGIVQMRRLEKIQERALRFLYNDNKSTYNELLKRAKYDTLHLRRIKTIAIEVFKSLNELNPSFMHMFKYVKTDYDFRDGFKIEMKRFNKMLYGRCTFEYYGAHLWNKLPNDFKSCMNIDSFKQMLSTWDGPRCNCNLCDFNP